MRSRNVGYGAGVPESVILRRVRFWLIVMVCGLVAAGLTAFPLATETRWLDGVVDHASWVPHFVARWIDQVTVGIRETGERYPFMAYGTDWLAYAHLMIAILFVGAVVDPVRNVCVVWFGLIACASVIPLALIAGPVRHIPFWWTCIDMSFGVLGAVPVLFALAGIRAVVATRAAAAARRPGADVAEDEPAPVA
jgi:hypothetical protein